MITNGNGDVYQTLAYCPQGEILYNSFAGDYDEPHKFTGYERDNESGLYYCSARYYWSDGSIPITTDPHWFNYPHITPYNWCGNDPVNRVDPTGMDWYENESGKVTWNDKVTNADNTPQGGKYIGANGSDILKFYGFKSNIQSQTSSARGQVLMGEEGYHFAGAETTTSLSVSANISLNEKAQSASNTSGLVFNGVNITANAKTVSTGSTEGDMGVMGGLSVKYGGKEYGSGFSSTSSESSITQTGSLNQTATILLPNGSLSKSNTAQSSVLVRGGYGVMGTDGFYRPLVLHGLLPFPRSFKQDFNVFTLFKISNQIK